MNNNVKFPIFRKYASGTSFFKVISFEEMEEVQVIGSRKWVHLLKATTYPDRVKIMEVIAGDENLFASLSEAEYHQSKVA